MRTVSNDELIELGHRFGIHVGEDEADGIREDVNGLLAGIDAVDDVPLDRPEVGGERSWREPTDDPLTALAVECDVPPSGGGPLDGLTAGIKDIIAVAGVPMGCSSDVMRGFVPGFDAAAVARLRAGGARIAAMTTADEFAGAGRGTTGARGPVRNPYDPERTAGGSSGGSAAAVATDRVDVALGTDTGGSVRIPSAFCGIVGLKPTHGLVPLHGVAENSYTQDHVGPMTGSVEDAARVLEVLAGKDERDPASMVAAGRDGYTTGGYLEAATDPPDLADLRIGLISEGMGSGIASPVEAATERALDTAEDAGAAVERVSIEGFEASPEVKNAISLVELAAHWRDGGAPIRRGGVVDEGYQISLARRAKQASGELNPYYRAKALAGARLIDAHDARHYTRAQAVRETLRAAFDAAFETFDALALPTMPDVAPRVEDADDPGFIFGQNTRIADLTRLPAISMPNGADDGLPIGFQLMGPGFDEASLVGIAAAMEPLLPEVPSPAV
jgi:amidase/aspartyl-tRNA(Asn)/glutamyl-tRNA(Gln) amidotransferase subunit A